MKKPQVIQDKWFMFLLVILAVYLVLKILERSNIIFVFPFDYINDISSYMARLFFLAKYGFHNVVPNWFNGDYILFTFSGPGWYYFTLPIYYLTRNIQIATYISLILVYILGLVFFLILGKIAKLSITKTLAFYLIFFANPAAIGNFIRLGKLPEMFGWVFFAIMFALILRYKDNKMSSGFLWVIPVYSIILLSSSPVFLVASLMIVSLFLVKTNKERFGIALVVLLVAVITSFWWYPYVTNSSAYYAGQRSEMQGFLFDPLYVLGDTLTSFVVMPIFFLIVYFYLKSKNYIKKELIFLLPSLFLAFLFFTRIIVFIPILNKPHPDSYHFFFLFLGIYLFLKTNFSVYPKYLKKAILASLIILPVFMVIIAQFALPPYVPNTEEDQETLDMLSIVGNHGNLDILGAKSYIPPYYAYGAIYFDTRTIEGYAIEEMKVSFIKQVEDMQSSFNVHDCLVVDKARSLKLDYIITYRDHCDFLKSCGLKEAERINNTCLYKV